MRETYAAAQRPPRDRPGAPGDTPPACGRYTLTDPDRVRARFDAADELIETRLVPRLNVAPSQQVPIVVHTPEGQRQRHG